MDPDSETGMPGIKFHGKTNTQHHVSYNALKNSAQSGCRLCIVLLGEVDIRRGAPFQKEDPKFNKPIYFEIQTGMLDVDAFQIYFLIETRDRNTGDTEVEEVTLRAQAVRGRFNIERDNNPTKGCFFQRTPEYIAPWKHTMRDFVDPSGIDAEDEYILVPRAGVRQGVSDQGKHIWRENLTATCTSLYRRGWVLQESLLAPRILHCSARQLYWECPSTVCCETFPAALPQMFWVTDDFYQIRRRLALPFAGPNHLQFASQGGNAGKSNDEKERNATELPIPLTHEAWLSTIETYTRCKLTFSKDKLMAISGIAAGFLPFLGDYCFGLWKSHLPLGLLWALDATESVKGILGTQTGSGRRNGPYRAPSWSWASVDGPVLFQSNPFAGGMINTTGATGFRTVIEILRLETNTRHPNGLGEIVPGSRACLLLKGSLLSITIGFCTTDEAHGMGNISLMVYSVAGKEFENYTTKPSSGLPQDFDLDQMISLLVGGESATSMGRTRIREQMSKVSLDDVHVGVLASGRGELWCLPILIKDFFGVWSVDGILLARSLETPDGSRASSMGPYKRIGYFSVNGQDSPGLGMFQDLTQVNIMIV
ncbi:hypothetical protein HJFPF1_07416 [Paramyrothecium foliicola]|nr:hypothetical protein HJFPF1_07416 [Paramyrothecium foliicola]